MEQGRTKRVKTSATRVRRREVGSPSTRDRGDPYYSLILQETRLVKFQGTVQFLELKGQVYPALVREFYANFRYKDGKYWSMISSNLCELNDDMFMNVGGLSSSGYGIGDCSWVKENFDLTEVYKLFLRGPHLYIQGQLTKAGSLSVENRLLHYIIAYILVQRNTNHAQPTVNDLRFIYKDGKYWSMISSNLFQLNDDMFMNVGGLSSSGYGIGDCSWVKENFDPTEVYKLFLRGPHLYIQGQLTKAGSLSVENRLLHYIIAYILVQRNTNHAHPTVNDLRFMYASKLLPYSIFISRIVDYLHIDVSDTIIVEYTDKNHLVCESLIHKMGIYKYGTIWQYQEDYTTIGLDLSDDDNQGGMGDQHATTQGEPSGIAPHNSAFGLDQLEVMGNGLTTELRNMIQSTVEAQNAMFCSEFQKLSVLIRGDQNIVIHVDHIDDPPPPPQP
ncbi:hypothetical protein Lal_00043397 [Lupinus albus]|nr:hypothetical protein Lal_00043397 [Lupinus albus]